MLAAATVTARRWYTATLIWAGLSVVLFLATGLAFQQLQHPQSVSLPVSKITCVVDGDSVIGRVTNGLPRFRLRWDGELPQAHLFDTAAGETLGASLIQESSLTLNRRGVLWLGDKDCRFVLDRATYESRLPFLVIFAEEIPSRVPFYGLLLAGIGAGLASLLSWHQYRLSSVPAWRRGAVYRACIREFAFVLLSLASVLSFYPGHPVAHMSGDPANIHSFAAAGRTPGDFTADAVLSDAGNYAWYTPLYVKFVALFGTLGFHYATSRAVLAFFSTLLALLGYFRLFRLISRSETFALCASVGLFFMKAHYPPNENWGPMLVLPRTVYGALLPWVAEWALRLMANPRWWWLPAAASGVLFYVHPVSSPALTGALLMGYVFAGPGKWWQRLAWGTLGGAAALAVMFPYVLIYSKKYSGTVVPDPVLVSQAMEIAKARFAPGYLEPLVFYRDLLIYLVTTPRYWFGFAALGMLWRKTPRSLTTRACLGWTLGFAIVTLIIPTVDVCVSQAMGRLPFQIDLIRNLRYIDVWLLGIIGAFLREISRPGWGRAWKFQVEWSAMPLGGVRKLACPSPLLAALLWTVVCYTPPAIRSLKNVSEMTYDNITILIGRPRGLIADEMEAFRAVVAMRHAGERVGGTFHLRQVHVPVAYNDKDLGILAYSTPQGLVRAKTVLTASEHNQQWPITTQHVQAEARNLEAPLLLMERDQVSAGVLHSPQTLFQNKTQVLVRIPSEVLTGPVIPAPAKPSVSLAQTTGHSRDKK